MEGERHKEEHQCETDWLPPTHTQICTPVCAFAWELNQRPFSAWADAPTTEQTGQGFLSHFFFCFF